MKKPLVSVIIPVFNTEKYIEKTLTSICTQTLDNIEIIVINDGSSDNSQLIIEKILQKDHRIKLFNQSNQGLSATRNAGLELAMGEYIYFMDSDDLLEVNALKECYQKCQSEQLDFVFFDAESFSDENITLRNYQYQRNIPIENKIWNGPEIFQYQYNTWSYRSSACLSFSKLEFLKQKNIRFYPDILHEDELYTPLLYLNASRVNYLPYAYFKRRIRQQSITTNTFSVKNLAGYFTVANELKKYSSTHPEHKDILHKHISRMLNAALRQAYRFTLYEKAGILKYCLFNYFSYLSYKTLFILLLKSYIKK